jgi:hypothetical protein
LVAIAGSRTRKNLNFFSFFLFSKRKAEAFSNVASIVCCVVGIVEVLTFIRKESKGTIKRREKIGKLE